MAQLLAPACVFKIFALSPSFPFTGFPSFNIPSPPLCPYLSFPSYLHSRRCQVKYTLKVIVQKYNPETVWMNCTFKAVGQMHVFVCAPSAHCFIPFVFALFTTLFCVPCKYYHHPPLFPLFTAKESVRRILLPSPPLFSSLGFESLHS